MANKTIWITNSRYHKYQEFDTWEEAYDEAKWQKNKNKTKYFILKVEKGYLFPRKRYILYLNKVVKFF